LSDVLADPACAAATRRIIGEGLVIAEAMGCTARLNVEKALANGRQSRHTPSIVQNLNLGRPMEIETLYAFPLAMSRQQGVATAMLDPMVVLAAHRAAAQGLHAV